MMVVDASLAMAWVFEDESSDATDALLDEVIADGGVVPPLWVAEVANVLTVAQRRGRVTAAEASRMAQLLGRLPLEWSELDPTISDVLVTAQTYGLSAYDATYLLVAMREGLPIGTLDASLRAAASAAGVGVGPSQWPTVLRSVLR